MNILVAVDGSENSDLAVQYAGTMLKDTKGAQITLFHVLRALPPSLQEHGGSENPATEAHLGAQLRKDQDAWNNKQREPKCNELTKARDPLANADFDTTRLRLNFAQERDVA